MSTALLTATSTDSEKNRVSPDRSWGYLEPLLEHLKPSLQFVSPDRRGCVVGNSKFGLDYFVRQYANAANDPYFNDEVLGHSLAQKASRLLDLQGPCLSLASACATGLHNIIFAAQRILDGDADVMVCGAAEASRVPVIEAAFDNMGVVSRRGICSPFDQDRDGFVASEGGAVCLLRGDGGSKRVFIANCEMRIAKCGVLRTFDIDYPKDTVNSQCELLGWGMTNDSTHPIHFHRSGEAIAVAIQKALRMAELDPSDIDLIYAHGTGTRLNDQIEANALRMVFGSVLENIPITSTKGSTGHLLGVAGAVELSLACEMLEGQFIYPTNCLHKDDDFGDLNIASIANCEMRIAKCGVLRTILKLNYGFGGQIAAIVLARA